MEAAKTLWCETCGADVEVLVPNMFGEYEGLGVADQSHLENCDVSDPTYVDEDYYREIWSGEYH